MLNKGSRGGACHLGYRLQVRSAAVTLHQSGVDEKPVCAENTLILSCYFENRFLDYPSPMAQLQLTSACLFVSISIILAPLPVCPEDRRSAFDQSTQNWPRTDGPGWLIAYKALQRIVTILQPETNPLERQSEVANSCSSKTDRPPAGTKTRVRSGSANRFEFTVRGGAWQILPLAAARQPSMSGNRYVPHEGPRPGEAAQQGLGIGHPELERLLSAQEINVAQTSIERPARIIDDQDGSR